MLKNLRKMKKYQYPSPQNLSLVMLPDGQIVGKSELHNHIEILEKALDRIILSKDCFIILAKNNLIHMSLTDLGQLSINVLNEMTAKQRESLQGLVMSEKYDIIIEVTEPCGAVSNPPSEKRVRWQIGLRF